MEEIIEARAFADAKVQYERARSAKDVPQGGMFDLVKAIEFELAAEELEARKAPHETDD